MEFRDHVGVRLYWRTGHKMLFHFFLLLCKIRMLYIVKANNFPFFFKKKTYFFLLKIRKKKKAWAVLYFSPENTLKDTNTSVWYQRCCKNSKIQGKTHQILLFLNSCQSLKWKYRSNDTHLEDTIQHLEPPQAENPLARVVREQRLSTPL